MLSVSYAGEIRQVLLNFDQTLKVGSWGNLYQIPIVMVMTFVQETYILATIVQ